MNLNFEALQIYRQRKEVKLMYENGVYSGGDAGNNSSGNSDNSTVNHTLNNMGSNNENNTVLNNMGSNSENNTVLNHIETNTEHNTEHNTMTDSMGSVETNTEQNAIFYSMGAVESNTEGNPVSNSTNSVGNPIDNQFGENNRVASNSGEYNWGQYQTTQVNSSDEGSTTKQFTPNSAEYINHIGNNIGNNKTIENKKDLSGGKKNKKSKQERKGGMVFRKLILTACLGLAFGAFTGVGCYAVLESTGSLEILSSNSNVIRSTSNGDSTAVTSTDAESQSGVKLTESDNTAVAYVSSDVSDVVEDVMPAMVSIVSEITSTVNYFGQSRSETQQGSGSGIIIAESDTELLIATNHHVVADASRLVVSFIDGTEAEAQIKGQDSDMDLAVISITLESLSQETKDAIAIATLGDSDNLRLGEPVIAIGNALGYGQSVTTGSVSALNREITMEDASSGTFIQTDAAINPGNSGGALLNVNGEVIGINSSKIGGSTIEGMGYAIPISAASPIIAELMLKETRVKVEESDMGYMGISLQTITDEFATLYNMPQGIYIISVEEGSAAQKAGIQMGDILVGFDGEEVSSYEDLQDILQYCPAGTTVSVSVMRAINGQYESIDLEITLGQRSQ